MARRRFFVDQIRGGRAVVSGDDAHHLTRVLRVEAGQRYEISDNREVWLAEVESARRDAVTFVVEERVPADVPAVQTTLHVALVKFERLELLIEKATELGVSRLAFFSAERSEKGLDRAAAKRLPRWRRIAREASEQSRRARLPSIEEPHRFADLLRVNVGLRLLLDEAEDAPSILSVLPREPHRDDCVSLLAGPEGGWTERERNALRESGWSAVSLGRTILRTETAAIAALAIVNAHWTRAESEPQP